MLSKLLMFKFVELTAKSGAVVEWEVGAGAKLVLAILVQQEQ